MTYKFWADSLLNYVEFIREEKNPVGGETIKKQLEDAYQKAGSSYTLFKELPKDYKKKGKDKVALLMARIAHSNKMTKETERISIDVKKEPNGEDEAKLKITMSPKFKKGNKAKETDVLYTFYFFDDSFSNRYIIKDGFKNHTVNVSKPFIVDVLFLTKNEEKHYYYSRLNVDLNIR